MRRWRDRRAKRKENEEKKLKKLMINCPSGSVKHT
jgi:hypothetical protein